MQRLNDILIESLQPNSVWYVKLLRPVSYIIFVTWILVILMKEDDF
jgi:hypothetical protein